jgi:hypothetical protein
VNRIVDSYPACAENLAADSGPNATTTLLDDVSRIQARCRPVVSILAARRSWSGLTGTIGSALVLLLDLGFVPHAQAIRDALERSARRPREHVLESYDATPVIDLNDPSRDWAACAMQTAMALAIPNAVSSHSSTNSGNDWWYPRKHLGTPSALRPARFCLRSSLPRNLRGH